LKDLRFNIGHSIVSRAVIVECALPKKCGVYRNKIKPETLVTDNHEKKFLMVQWLR
jgi:hypothetical protein